MKKDTHPTYHSEAKVTCACGNSFSVGSTEDKISVEICSACHPFFTGEEKIIDTGGRVERFKRRSMAAKTDKSKSKKAENKEEKNTSGKEVVTEA